MLGFDPGAIVPVALFLAVALFGLLRARDRPWSERWLATTGALALLAALWATAAHDLVALGIGLAAAAMSFGLLAIAETRRIGQ